MGPCSGWIVPKDTARWMGRSTSSASQMESGAPLRSVPVSYIKLDYCWTIKYGRGGFDWHALMDFRVRKGAWKHEQSWNLIIQNSRPGKYWHLSKDPWKSTEMAKSLFFIGLSIYLLMWASFNLWYFVFRVILVGFVILHLDFYITIIYFHYGYLWLFTLHGWWFNFDIQLLI